MFSAYAAHRASKINSEISKMRSGERAPGSRPSLDKPLEELTEEDIIQLTREDCRRYLKEKGMRRPSWNKSQAIQQVISLKSLFESKPNQEPKKPSKYKPATLQLETARDSTFDQSTVSQEQTLGVSWSKDVPNKGISERQGLCSDPKEAAEIPRLGNKSPQSIAEGMRCTQDSHGPRSTQPFLGLPANFKNDCSNSLQFHTSESQSDTTLRSEDSFQQPTAQLTIFYAGMVNVYDDVPLDKAQAIVRLAGNGKHIPPPPPVSNDFAVRTGYQDARNAKHSTAYAPTPAISVPDVLDSPIPSEWHSELSKSRKARVQRFLKKRMDRGRLKAASASATSKAPSFDMYLQNPQLNLPTQSDNRSFHSSSRLYGQQPFNRQKCSQSSGSETSSPTIPPQTPCRSSSSSHAKAEDRMTLKHQNEGDSLNTCNEDKCFNTPSE